MKKVATRIWLSISAGLVWASALAAQELPSAPVPVAPPGASAPAAPAPSPRLSPPPPPAPLPPISAPYQENNGGLLPGDPLLDRPGSPPPGWFASLELNVLAPHIQNRLQGQVAVDGFVPDTVHLPTAPLDWTGAPRLDIGYRLPEGCGEFLVGYRFLVSEGTNLLYGFDLDGGDAFLKSRLNMNVIDLDYASREYSLGRYWDMKWRVGGRIAVVYFDSLAEGVFLEQKTSNHFVGGGPHAGLDLWRSLDWPGLSLFGRIDGATVIGQISQSFEETFPDENGNLVGAATLVHHTQAVPVLGVQAGLSWTPYWRRHLSRYALGYEFERWWSVGDAGDSQANITTQGVFFRAEFGF